jgi:DNA replication protein DnaC
MRRLAVLSHPAVLVVDETGYLPITHTGAVLFFQLMNGRYEHPLTVLIFNKRFEEWGSVFGDEVMAAALIDRVLHHCHMVNIRGNSYRTREHTDLYRSRRDELLVPPETERRSRRTEVTQQ